MRFDACAKTYDAHARPQQFFASRVAEFARVRPGEAIVELGAGTGALTKPLCQSPSVTVLATDVSPAMVEIGRERAPGAAWALLDAFQDVIPAADLQISSGLLQWAAEPLQIIEKWRRSLRPSGRMVHAFPCEPCLQEWRQIIPESPLRWRTPGEWNEIFSAASTMVVRQELWIERCKFESAFDMLRSLHRSGVTGHAKVSSGRLRRGIRDYEQIHRTSDGVSATWAWMAIEAVNVA